MDIRDAAVEAVKAATRHGAEFADCSADHGFAVGVELAESKLKSSDTHYSEAMILRAFVKGGRGASLLSSFEPDEIRRVAEKTVRMARAAAPDPDFVGLPKDEPAPEVNGLYDERITGLDAGGFVEHAVGNIDRAKAVAEDVQLSGSISAAYSDGAFANSEGVCFTERDSSLAVSMSTVIKRNGDVGMFHDFDLSRSLDDIDFETLGETTTKEALAYMGARPITGGTMSLVLGPLATHALVQSIAHATSAENIQRRRSFLKNSFGKRVAPEFFTLTDNALIDGGISSGARDGEGAVTKVVEIFRDGVFAAKLYNSYTANKEGVPNTGHGGRDFSISPTNTLVSTGTTAANELIGGVRDGLYLNLDAVMPDSITGDISLSADFAFKIENGELAYPVSNVMISGNIFSLLERVAAVSSDYREEPGCRWPTILIDDITIVGEE